MAQGPISDDDQNSGPAQADDGHAVAAPPGAVTVDLSEAALRERLTPEQFMVTQHAATERPFTGIYWDTTDHGTYSCVVCGAQLFSSTTKFDAGCGWPSFWETLDESAVTFVEDHSFGMHRTEVLCARCGAHLGHVFPDGPAPTGDRYCMNSASLSFEPQRTEP